MPPPDEPVTLDPETAPDPAEVERLSRARLAVEARIAAACARVGRDPADVTLVAVSKTVAADRLRAAVAAGLTTLGENRVQEGEAKQPAVPGAVWHLVGPLQSNKARRALETFDVIETVDSVDLARRLDRIAGELRAAAPLPVLVQVNVDRDAAKAGVAPDDLDRLLGEVTALASLEVRGLMTVGRLTTDRAEARATFDGLADAARRARDRWPGLGPALSMGMSDDYELAVEAGATIVRVGRAIFGERPHVHGPGEAPHAH